MRVTATMQRRAVRWAVWPCGLFPGRSTGPHRSTLGRGRHTHQRNGHHMADLNAVATRLREQRGLSLRALAKAIHHDPSYLTKALRGVKPCGPALARAVDKALGADGEI